MTDAPPTVAFVCVQNAGRSQIAAAFAERERERRATSVEVVTGGTDPADAVHATVIAAMLELDIDLGDRTPRRITTEELRSCDLVITMGCDADDVCPATMRPDARDWDLPDPGEADLGGTRAIRDEIEERVASLFDELDESDTI